ncbi:MAG TPA: cytidine deaminase [Acetomicrobium flavidum]|uniref:Cytidine deaminase n=1 Tax=Acetomicrobium mobile (strain ATCC BAA-54 / DSM 13181 / JCM 12221 / NGA) TaxID=891968 RepID=I4BXT5_ACEMN|nr:cytidine deaminase [Acetomicrobium mobile]AFM22092.1 cytidine deaminase [Acetomicrobium mobile DSM 13181]HOJ81901.1 cytidine deaminase [Acetomicrobium flavidum]HPP13844.1 cytidine deaminase [Acetomicrobium flavidum]
MSAQEQELFALAKEARESAYAPYSDFKVGAALLGESGTIYLGCNVENASFGLTVCAERVALFKAVSEGERVFKAIAIYAGSKSVPPCGACLQVMAEFGDLDILLFDSKGSYVKWRISELLPQAFRLND